MTSGKSVALVQSRAAPSTVTRETDFPAVINVGYCPRVRAITNTCWRESPSLIKRSKIAIERCILSWVAFLFATAKAKYHLTKSDFAGHPFAMNINEIFRGLRTSDWKIQAVQNSLRSIILCFLALYKTTLGKICRARSARLTRTL